ncbi:MAG: DUF2064 domain-containing protein [Dehalococcoidia bacterium]|uniref:DUF2064 domain-containing protein n=1 Tax=Candidatus Amarobacter glycogenicus TaxID=3140699 RepID=UPI003134D551|nr:DUF2064 domain-containing protein [Dehalococcoidia bacterium]
MPPLQAFLFDTLDACAAADATTMVAFTPATEAAWFRYLAPGLLLSAQPEGSFGERLRAAMQAAFGAGFSTVAVIGSDVPHLRSATIDAGLDIAARPGRPPWRQPPTAAIASSRWDHHDRSSSRTSTGAAVASLPKPFSESVPPNSIWRC